MSDNKEIGFCRALFMGKIKEEVINPFPETNKEEEETISMFLDSVRKFAKEKIDPAKIDNEGKIPDEVIKGMRELGLFAMTIPIEYGGIGLSQYGYGKVMEELTKYCASTAVFLGAHLSIGIKGIILFGTQQQKEKYLKRVVEDGKTLACFALTEPEAGCDVNNMKTHAELSEDGKYYIINGSKQWITNSNIADLITLFAKVEVEENGKDKVFPSGKEKKITAFIVTKDMGGITVGPEDKKMGIKASPTCSFCIENLKVPVENILGEKGKGFKVAMNVLNNGRLGLATGCIGVAKKAIELSRQHSKERIQFQVPISEFEMIKGKFAEMSSLVFAMESITELTSKNADRGIAEGAIESAICKVFCSESLWKIVNHAVQINGGNGYMKEYPYERFLRDARINMIFEGTNEILRLFIALEGIKLPSNELVETIKGPFGKLKVAVKFAIKNILPKPRLSGMDGSLQDVICKLEKLTKKFSLSVDKVLMKYGKKIIQKEFLQERIAEIIIDLYVTYAMVSKVNELIKQKGKLVPTNREDNVSNELNMLKFFSSQAFLRINSNINGLFKNNDKIRASISDNLIKEGK
jgi:acyl-CoA dehydrogenase family protein 9